MKGATHRGIATILVIGLLTGLALPGVTAGQTTDSPPDTDNTITRIQLHPNGSATWFIQVRTRLETDEEVDQYRRFQERIRADNTRLDTFRTQMTSVIRTAANTTGRDMSARSFSLSTHIQEVPRRWGVVTYHLLWTGFAATDGNTLVVGDVFDGGFFLASEDRLVIVPPPGYRIVDRAPAPDDVEGTSLVWAGREDFADERPYVRLEPSSTGQTATTQATGGGTDDQTTVLPGNPGWIGGVAILLITAGLVVLARRLRTGSKSPPIRGATDPSDQGGPSIVTDTERVIELLETNEGQLRQRDIDNAVEWSSSKTSRVLAEMAETGTIEKLRIGRENVIRLADTGEPSDTE